LLFSKVKANITGNEDMHLKNFSVITKAGKTNLTPVYDFINSSISINNPQEELALSLKGKKSNFKATELIDYYAKERLELNNKTIDSILFDMNKSVSKWTELIEISFLSDKMKEKYLKLMNDRVGRF
jgi:serine/threonine-protein kinase HipA